MPVDDGLSDGSIGWATRGDLTGRLVIFSREFEDAWILYWRNPAVPDDEARLGDDYGDSIVPNDEYAHHLVQFYGVEWLPAEEQERYRAEYFPPEPERPPGPSQSLSSWFKRLRNRDSSD
jgi:hypothetical protein